MVNNTKWQQQTIDYDDFEWNNQMDIGWMITIKEPFEL
jgi:hypothetical protein